MYLHKNKRKQKSKHIWKKKRTKKYWKKERNNINEIQKSVNYCNRLLNFSKKLSVFLFFTGFLAFKNIMAKREKSINSFRFSVSNVRQFVPESKGKL